MYINSLLLKNIRNLENLNLNLNKNINIFYGDNGQGKTNILESIYFCSKGRSHRTYIDKELIKFGEKESYIKLIINNEDFINHINVNIKNDFKKGITINNIPIKKIGDLFGKLLVIIFSPEDLKLIKSGPSERRKFIDIELCQLNSNYYYNLKEYYSTIKQRNNLLKKIQKDNNLKDTIFIWDEQLLFFGKKIINYRKDFINKLNNIANNIHSNITNNKETLTINYNKNVSEKEFMEKLKKNIDKDIFYGNTSVGIHKDDINVLINGKESKIYGSQGQQRTIAISLKLAQIEIIKEEKNTLPILLLDDVLSELDINRQSFLLKYINSIQTIITCTGIEDIIKNLSNKKNINIYEVKNGNIIKN